MISNDICQAVLLLKNNDVVALPTETVYGLAGNALSDTAVVKIYAMKDRPTFNPLICHVASLEEAQRYGVFNGAAFALAKAFWPGPLTLVVMQKNDAGISKLATCGLETVGLRVPSHALMRKVIEDCGFPLAAPSANASGLLSPTCADHVQKSLGKAAPFILNGGASIVGLESTIVDVSGSVPMLLRPGAITLDMLEKIVPDIQQKTVFDDINAPGQLLSHYAPKTSLRLNAQDAIMENEALLTFGGALYKGYAKILNLSEKADLTEAAANLFAYLHNLDEQGFKGIAATSLPDQGLGVAMNDRLKRAAHR